MRTHSTQTIINIKFTASRLIILNSFISCLMACIFNQNTFAQSCPNVDFSSGTFANWQGRTGTCCPINLPTVGIVGGRHTIIAAPGTDANTGGGLVLPAPGFAQVARLGNAVNGAQAEGLSYTILVDPTNALFIYTYAVVLEEPGHAVADQPRFELQVRDQFNNIIPCTFYEVAAGAGVPGFQTFGTVVWKDWEQVGVDLSAYMGQTVTIEARTGDCDLGGHFGYGYLVGQCMPLSINLNFCAGATSATLTAPNGFTSYLWSTGETAQTINIPNPTLGQIVTCTVTSVTGCQAILTSTLNPVVVNGTTVVNNSVSCFGGNNGSATVTPTGGTGPYTYSWAPSGGNNATATNLSAGVYTVTITESSNNCTGTSTVTITQPASPITISGISSNVLCNGGNTGSINITTSGGTPGYSYSWDNGATTEDINALTAGTYNVIVTDINNCTNTFTQLVGQPLATLSVNSTQTNVSCFNGNNGSINITPAGGTAPYTYLWNTGVTSEDITGIIAGNYSVIIADVNGCVTNHAVTITQPPAITIAATQNNILCFGANTGTINITPIGGTGAYTYSWSNGSTSQDLIGLMAGNYSVVVSDINGCNQSFATTITQTATPITISGIVTPVACYGTNGGAIDITTVGGAPGYTSLWNNGATSQDISGLAAGNYGVVVTDINGCTANYSQTINQPAAPLSVTGSSNNINCFGANTGNINIFPAGGTLGYSFLWSNGATTQNINGLTAGLYNVTVTDANGCTATFSTNITQQPAIVVNSTQANIACFGGNTGSINLSATGGAGGYSYSWSNGQSTEDITGLTVGGYSVLVTDAYGCTNNYTTTITQPGSALNVTGTTVNIDCFGNFTGSINITPTGGSPFYSYLWSNGSTNQDLNSLSPGTYSVIVSDLSGCTNNSFSATITEPTAPLTVTGISTNILCFGDNNGSIQLTTTGGTPGYTYTWNNGSTNEDISFLAPGNYQVTVTDANGCINNSYTAIITQPSSPIAVTGATTNIACYGMNTGTINTTITGGNPLYSFTWNNGGTSEDLNSLAAGTYNLIVTDANGCTNSSFSATISQPSSALMVNGDPNNPSCNGTATGNIEITASGGIPPYLYNWNTGSPDEDIYNLNGGTYNVLVTDGNGCSANGAWTLIDPQAINIIPTIQSISCYGINDGFISLTIIGGSAPYNVLWNTGNINPNLSNIGPGNYSVTVMDANGCVDSGAYTILNTLPLYVNLDSIHTIWLGESVELEALANGGTAPYTYNWTPPENLSCTDCQITEASPLLNTNYAVTVTDVNGCTAVAGAHIELMYALYVPNTFTPNGDGDNDQFNAVSASVKKFTMRIFDRWGEEVFSTANINDGWDGFYRGIESKQDVYVYRIEATFVNGKYEELIGQVTLLR